MLKRKLQYFLNTKKKSSGELPDGYTRCDYLESTGTQWIDTKYDIQPTDKFKLDYMITDSTSPNIYSATGASNMRFHLWKSSQSGYAVLGLGKGFNNKTPINVNIRTLLEVDASASTNPKVNGVEYPKNSTTDYSAFIKTSYNTTLRIFTADTTLGKVRIYDLEIKGKMHLIPALDTNDEPCFYDTVSKQTFYNNGTGDFKYKIEGQIPKNYTRCLYLQSNPTSKTSGQYIDTGIKTKGSMGIEIKAQNSLSTGYDSIFFWYGGENLWRTNSFDFSSGSGGWGVVYNDIRGKESGLNTTTNLSTKPYTIKVKDGVVLQDGVDVGHYTKVDFTSNSNLFIFGICRKQSLVRLDGSKIFYVKLWDNDDLIMELVPCLDGSNEPCMYDMVSGETFYNKGTGNFLYELAYELPSEYTELDYIETTGTQFIDTGLTSIKNTYTYNFIVMPKLSSTNFIIGRNPTVSNNDIGVFYSTGKITIQNGANSRVITNATVNVDHNVEFSKGYGTVDGLKSTATAVDDFTNDNKLYYGKAYNDTSSRNFQGKLGILKIFDENNAQILYLVPCKRNSDDELGMYDLVSKTFKENAGTGDFKYE